MYFHVFAKNHQNIGYTFTIEFNTIRAQMVNNHNNPMNVKQD